MAGLQCYGFSSTSLSSLSVCGVNILLWALSDAPSFQFPVLWQLLWFEARNKKSMKMKNWWSISCFTDISILSFGFFFGHNVTHISKNSTVWGTFISKNKCFIQICCFFSKIWPQSWGTQWNHWYVAAVSKTYLKSVPSSDWIWTPSLVGSCWNAPWESVFINSVLHYLYKQCCDWLMGHLTV